MMADPTSAADDPTPPEVTIEPADNGFVVRHHQRSSKKDEPGRTIRRVASSTEEALGHAKTALSGGSGGKSIRASKKKSPARSEGAPAEGALGEHAMHHSTSSSASRHRLSARRPRHRQSRRG